jgi:hypothetical protein
LKNGVGSSRREKFSGGVILRSEATKNLSSTFSNTQGDSSAKSTPQNDNKIKMLFHLMLKLHALPEASS